MVDEARYVADLCGVDDGRLLSHVPGAARDELGVDREEILVATNLSERVADYLTDVLAHVLPSWDALQSESAPATIAGVEYEKAEVGVDGCALYDAVETALFRLPSCTAAVVVALSDPCIRRRLTTGPHRSQTVARVHGVVSNEAGTITRAVDALTGLAALAAVGIVLDVRRLVLPTGM